uniref:Peptidase_M14 domain-containing protein n=1 Tax=Steinernema glaseri TaxID=37863 RepID=A0A1I7ZDV2_9BILA
MWRLIGVPFALVCCISLVEAGETPHFDFTRYHDYNEIKTFIVNTAKQNKDFVKLVKIGVSNDGRPLLGLKPSAPKNKIGFPVNATDKRAVWIDGGNHAREWPAFHCNLFFINELVNKYERDDKITEYINNLNIYVFPVLNPDGFIFSRTSTVSLIRQWRKNKAPENCTGYTAFKKNMCCDGVDLNRNYDFSFKQTNVPFNNPCSDEFQGPFPFSEPESIAVRDFILSKEMKGKVDAYVSLHTHGQIFILPYNDHKKSYPDDYADLEALALKATSAIQAYRGTEYKVGTAADLLGPATGGASDWIKKNTDTKYVYVIELPPSLFTWFAFQMRPHWLVPTAEETWLGVKVIIEQVLQESKDK